MSTLDQTSNILSPHYAPRRSMLRSSSENSKKIETASINGSPYGTAPSAAADSLYFSTPLTSTQMSFGEQPASIEDPPVILKNDSLTIDGPMITFPAYHRALDQSNEAPTVATESSASQAALDQQRTRPSATSAFERQVPNQSLVSRYPAMPDLSLDENDLNDTKALPNISMRPSTKTAVFLRSPFRNDFHFTSLDG